jgi:hypothetical protein
MRKSHPFNEIEKKQEDFMQIRNATYDGQLDLLDCRATMLGLDVYAIQSDKMFAKLRHRCFDCSFHEECAADLRRDPNDPAWQIYCPNSATLECLADDLWR